MNKTTKNHQIQLAAISLLLKIAKCDNKIDSNEINVINNIISDFFQISINDASSLIKEGLENLDNSIDLFHFGRIINHSFNKQDKIDFITCIYEVAYADGKLHYLEDHAIKNIANILHLEKHDLINSKKEILQFLDI
tara:strand:- start:381 stop:791 length:411 start_codon:yes stop_codon:yes gene_type:complete